jgi:hypothetical protein
VEEISAVSTNLDDIKYKAQNLSESMLGSIDPAKRKLIYIGVPLLLLLAVVWTWSLRKMAASDEGPGAIDATVWNQSLVDEDTKSLSEMSIEQLRAAVADRKNSIQMAKFEKTLDAIPKLEESLKRAEAALAAKKK